MTTHFHPEEFSDISLRLEHYDDIFSDFDMRPYSERALSVDFLEEIKRAARDKHGKIRLALHAPDQKRDETNEKLITDRLIAHFNRHHNLLRAERFSVLKLGISMVVLGALSMVAATFIVFEDPTESLLLSFLVVFLEPAAWFMLWEGMDQIIFNSKNIHPELDFYRKMSAADGEIVFKSYEA